MSPEYQRNTKRQWAYKENAKAEPPGAATGAELLRPEAGVHQAGQAGERAVMEHLATLGDLAVFSRVLVKVMNADGTGPDIDHIVIQKGRLAIVETKFFGGTIWGDNTSRTWTQERYVRGGAKRQFQLGNPIRAVLWYKEVFRRRMLEKYDVNVWPSPVVVLTGDCMLNLQEQPAVPIVNVSDLPSAISGLDRGRNDPRQLQNMFFALMNEEGYDPFMR